MRHRLYLFLSLLSLILAFAAGCIKDESLNAECDIVSASLPGNLLNRAPDVRNRRVIFVVKPGTDITVLAPEFTLTPGATINPPSGTVRDFTTPQQYVVTSQSGEWSKTYTVEVDDNAKLALSFTFENARLVNDCYHEFYATDTDGNVTLTWASANSAYLFTGVAKSPEEFPTYQIDNGRGGRCVALTTRTTGRFGALAKKPLAAGSIFMGRFDSSSALVEPLKATQFGGTPIYSVPVYFKGEYRYVPGPVYQEMDADGKAVEVPGMTDRCNIYSVFYEVTDDMEWLDGTNVMADDNKNIVAVARFEPSQQTEHAEWTEFSLPFKFRRDVDPQKLVAGKYSITIVASSSTEGDFFAGAVGSTLMVDKFTLTCAEY